MNIQKSCSIWTDCPCSIILLPVLLVSQMLTSMIPPDILMDNPFILDRGNPLFNPQSCEPNHYLNADEDSIIPRIRSKNVDQGG